MKYLFYTLLPLCLYLSAYIVQAQPEGDPEKQGPQLLRADAEGTHFIVGFMQNEESTSICALVGDYGLARHRISIASRLATEVTITYPDGSEVKRSLQPGEVTSLQLDGDEYECSGEGVCDKSISITADEPVSVYCFSSLTHTSDGYLALPVSSWGTEYYTLNGAVDYYPPGLADDDNCRTEPRPGEFAIIAGEDFTTVTVVATAPTRSGTTANRSQQKVLMKGEIWQVQAAGTVRGKNDITGSQVTSDKPVGLLSGHARTGVPWTLDTKDYLVEMLPPVESLGNRYIVVPFGGRLGGDLVRIVATQPVATDVIIKRASGDVNIALTSPGEFEEVLVSEVSVIESTQPVLVGHYSQSNAADPTGATNFDPYLIVTTPEEQFANAAVFQTMPDGVGFNGRGTQFDQHFATIVCEKENFNTIRLNGLPLANDPRIIAQGNVPTLENEFFWLTIRLPDNQAFVIQGTDRFGGYVYGIGEFDSYGWPIGSGDGDIAVDDIFPPALTTRPLCDGSLIEVKVEETGFNDQGLASVLFLPTLSSNVTPEIDQPVQPGSSEYIFRLRLIDPDMRGKGVVRLEDLAGNIDTVEVELYVNRPVFTPASLLFDKAKISVKSQQQITIINQDTSNGMMIEDVRLIHGKEFRLKNNLSGSIELDPDADFSLEVTFESAQRGIFIDTLILTIDCNEYRIPLRAVIGGPKINHLAKIDFGSIWVGEQKCVETTIRNTGTDLLVITSLDMEGDYHLDAASLPSLPLSIPPGEEVQLKICFTPVINGRANGRLVIRSDDPDATESQINLTGAGNDELGSVDEEDGEAGERIGVVVEGEDVLISLRDLTLDMSKVRLYTLRGKAVRLESIVQTGKEEWQFRLGEHLPNGVYLLVWETSEGSAISQRFVIRR